MGDNRDIVKIFQEEYLTKHPKLPPRQKMGDFASDGEPYPSIKAKKFEGYRSFFSKLEPEKEHARPSFLRQNALQKDEDRKLHYREQHAGAMFVSDQAGRPSTLKETPELVNGRLHQLMTTPESITRRAFVKDLRARLQRGQELKIQEELQRKKESGMW